MVEIRKKIWKKFEFTIEEEWPHFQFIEEECDLVRRVKV